MPNPRDAKSTVPPKLPDTTPPLPSGDYSYTVELVGSIQNQLGKLTEAIESLKVQTKDNSTELKAISKDIHAAKVVGGVLVIVGGIVGWAISQLVQYLSVHPAK